MLRLSLGRPLRCQSQRLVLGLGLISWSRRSGALVKDGAGDDVKIRLLYDGTHGVQVNERIRVRDRDRMPSAPDLKRVLHEVH